MDFSSSVQFGFEKNCGFGSFRFGFKKSRFGSDFFVDQFVKYWYKKCKLSFLCVHFVAFRSTVF